jgi:hypothetical protein
MRPRRIPILATLAALSLVPACGPPAPSDTGHVDAAAEEAALRTLLDEFLANADVRSAHERFWAEELVYTSSDGTRTGMAEILAGFEEPEAGPAVPAAVYSSDQVDVRVYGTTAVVAFRLVIDPPEGSGEARRYNLNTGTFLKRDGEWRAVAWQSTRAAE